MKKRKGKRVLKNLRLICFVGALLYLGTTLLQQELSLKALSVREAEQMARLDELEAEIAEVQTDLEEADSKEFVEKKAREKLGLVKPGEIIYIPDRTPDSDVKMGE